MDISGLQAALFWTSRNFKGQTLEYTYMEQEQHMYTARIKLINSNKKYNLQIF